MTRVLVHLPKANPRGSVVQVRATIAHPMESGHRRAGDGQLMAQDIVRHFEARLDGQPVFAAELHAALSANPTIAFHLRATASGTLELSWRGDRGFAHSESVAFDVV